MTTKTDAPAQVGVFEWQRALSKFPKTGTPLTSGVVAVALSLSLFANYETGRNAHPSRAALALAANVTKRTVSDALAVLGATGWIVQTGTLHSGVKVWRLSIPAAVPLVFPEVAAAAGIPAQELTAGGTRGEADDTRGGGIQHQEVKETTPEGEADGTRTSSVTSSVTSSPTSPTHEPAPWTGSDPWEGVVVACGPPAGAASPVAPASEPQPTICGDPWEGLTIAGAR